MSIFNLPSWFNSSMSTSARESTRRLKIENRPTSFEDNRQFRYFEVLDSVSHTSEIVYKFTATNPVVILLRQLDLYQGGRLYVVHRTDGVTFNDGLLSDASNRIFNVNGDLTKSGRTVHPATGVTMQKAVVAAGTFISANSPPNGTVVLTDGNANRATTAYGPSDQLAGVSAGQSFYLVFNHIGQNNATSGLFQIIYEESGI